MDETEEQQVAEDNYDYMKAQNVHETFTEKEELIEIIKSLKSIHGELIKTEKAIERFTVIVDEYQEQPHLLDPYLEELVNLIISTARQPDCEDGHIYLLFTCLHLLTKLRGYKVIIRWLPHEVSDVETVLEVIQKQDPNNANSWQNRYGMLLWLSMVAMIPFDLVKLDNTAGAGDNKLPVMDRILNIGKLYLCATDKSSDAAAYMLAKFLTRPDVRDKRMAETIDWALTALKTGAGEETFTLFTTNAAVSGTLRMLALLYKNGKREDLIPYAGLILHTVMNEPVICMSTNIVIRKLGVKLIQRIGLVYLKAKVASWRYNRGSRSLADNLAGGPKAGVQSTMTSTVNEDDEDYDLPDEIEEVIGHLLTSLKDKDTIVRWSAAKGIGRVTGRLPRELADDIIGSLLELFTIQETDAAWHGGCLALAELGRRGLLLPQRLPEVIKVIVKSLNYDEKKGFSSVGAHVRDAACYVCWSFARAYDPHHFREYAIQIASALLVVTVFDKEVNVRRAASAAFQENVGRQGTFPHGIDIVTTCDFFAVGNRLHSYLVLSKFVAGFSEYTRPLIDHLVEFKLTHWSPVLRVLAAKALHNLTPLDSDYILSVVLPKLLPMTTGPDLNGRHGAINAIGQVSLALTKGGITIPGEAYTAISEIESTLRSRKLLLGLGGDYMRMALCSMISDVAEAGLFKNHQLVGEWQELIDECLCSVERHVQEAAINALPQFFKLYISEKQELDPGTREKIVGGYISKVLKPVSEITRIGCTMALGSLPRLFVHGKLNLVLSALMTCTRMSDMDKDWAMARKDAYRSIEMICETVGVEANGSPNTYVCKGNIDEIYDSYIRGLQDYTIDSRGDIGAWVREACMTAIQSLTSAVVAKEPQLLNRQFIEKIFKMISQQACEKIDRTRDHAGRIFVSMLYAQPQIPYVPSRTAVEAIFKREELPKINFCVPRISFPLFSQMLDIADYRYNVLLGFTVSVGGLTESLVKHSHAALLNHLETDESANHQRLKNMCTSLIQILNNHVKEDRVTVPLMKMTGQLLSCGVFEDLVDDESFNFPMELFEAIKTETARSADPEKLMTSGEVLCGLLMFAGPVRQKCLFQLAIFLCHRFPIVRKTTSTTLFECLITNDLVSEENSEQVMSLLSDTTWDQSVDKIRPVRNNICQLLGISVPVIKKAKTSDE